MCIWLFSPRRCYRSKRFRRHRNLRHVIWSGSSSFQALNSLQDSTLQEDQEETQRRGILRVFGPDRNGIVTAFSQLLNGHGCGIFDSEQSTDTATNMFFQRITFDYSSMHTDEITLESGIREVCERLDMNTDLDWNKNRKRVAIMVSKTDHCLWEILLRHKAGELDCDISAIISNHPDLKPIADTFGIPFEGYQRCKERARGKRTGTTQRTKRRSCDYATDVGYINQRNKRFNEKISRNYDEHTAEIRQSLERGTAL